jgi:hypothetical protein
MRKTKNENPLAHCNLTTILSRNTSSNTITLRKTKNENPLAHCDVEAGFCNPLSKKKTSPL